MSEQPQALTKWQAQMQFEMILYRKQKRRKWSLTEVRNCFPRLGIPAGVHSLNELSDYQKERLMRSLMLSAVIAEAVAEDLGLGREFPFLPFPEVPGFGEDPQHDTFRGN